MEHLLQHLDLTGRYFHWGRPDYFEEGRTWET